MAAKIARRLTAGAVATGSLTATVWADAMPALVVAMLAVLVTGSWVLSNNARTNRLVRVIAAVSGPAGVVRSPTAALEPRSHASIR